MRQDGGGEDDDDSLESLVAGDDANDSRASHDSHGLDRPQLSGSKP
jgi:hypothetical protein